MRPLLIAAAMPLFLAGPALAQTVDRCQAVVQSGEELVTLEEPTFSIADRPGVLTRPDVAGELALVSCQRASIVPLPGDYRVLLDLGVPLTIIHGERVAVLELVEGRLNYRMISGAVLPGDVAPIQQTLNDAQTIINASQ